MNIKVNKGFESEIISGMLGYLGEDRLKKDEPLAKVASSDDAVLTEVVAELVSVAEALEERGSDLVNQVDEVLDIFDTEF